MMSTIPLSILLQGPVAVANYLTREAEEAKHRRPADKIEWKNIHSRVNAIFHALDLHPDDAGTIAINGGNVVLSMGASMMATVIIAYAAKGEQRGQARDFLNGLLDDCFDVVEEMAEDMHRAEEKAP